MNPPIREDQTQHLREALSPTELASSLSKATLRRFSKVDATRPRGREMSTSTTAGLERRQTRSYLEFEAVVTENARLTPNEVRPANVKTMESVKGHLERPEGAENMKTNAELQLEVAVGVVTPAMKAIYEHASAILGARK